LVERVLDALTFVEEALDAGRLAIYLVQSVL
jgi:hypothetical protein